MGPSCRSPIGSATLSHDCAATCSPGLESILVTELRALGLRPGPGARGFVPFSASTRQLYSANLWLRTAEAVEVRLGSFGATTFSSLERRLADLEWDPWLRRGSAIRVRASSRSSTLYHTGAVAERVHRVTGCPAADPADPATGATGHEDVGVVVRIARDRVSVSIDTSGSPLHRRGWRLATAKAPLRPTLAAALLVAVGWDGTMPLVDPFCGSGTVVIEAARLARSLPPAEGRHHAVCRTPGFEPGTWASVTGEARSRARATAGVALVGADRDAGAVAAATGNAGRAQVAGDVRFEQAAVSALESPGGVGWVVTNPPFGTRVGGGDLRNLYARFGDVVRSRLAGWGVILLCADRRLADHTGLPLTRMARTRTGGLGVEFLATGPPEGPGDGPGPPEPAQPVDADLADTGQPG